MFFEVLGNTVKLLLKKNWNSSCAKNTTWLDGKKYSLEVDIELYYQKFVLSTIIKQNLILTVHEKLSQIPLLS